MPLSAPPAPLLRAALQWVSPAEALFWVLVLNIITATESYVLYRCSLLAIRYVSTHVSLPMSQLSILPCHGAGQLYTRITHQYHPICIGYNSVIDFLSPVTLLLCIVLHIVDPQCFACFNSSFVVVRRAMCSPPHPERRLPGDHSRTT